MSQNEILLVGNGMGLDPVLMVHVAVGTGLPFLVGLVTTKLTPGWIKGSLLVALTVASNVGAELAQALVLKTDFALVDVTVFSALQLAYSVGLHKSVIASGPIADWLATHLKKADQRQVDLIETGWVGPVPPVKELDRLGIKTAEEYGIKQNQKSVSLDLTVNDPALQGEIQQGVENARANYVIDGTLPWSNPEADVLGDLRAHKGAIEQAPQKECIAIRQPDGKIVPEWLTWEEIQTLAFVGSEDGISIFSRPRKHKTDAWGDMVVRKIPEGAEQDTDGTWVYGGVRYMTPEVRERLSCERFQKEFPQHPVNVEKTAEVKARPNATEPRHMAFEEQGQDEVDVTPVATDYKSKHRAGDGE